MSEAYVTSKIQEALHATDGNKRDAQKLLITWAVRDPTLLLGLTKPHLKAIVAAGIDHVAALPAKESKQEEADLQFTKKDIAAMVSSKPIGEKRKAAPPPKSSSRQADVMHQLADAYKKKKTK